LPNARTGALQELCPSRWSVRVRALAVDHNEIGRTVAGPAGQMPEAPALPPRPDAAGIASLRARPRPEGAAATGS